MLTLTNVIEKLVTNTTPGSENDTAVEEAKTSITDSGLWQNVIVPISVGLAVIVLLFGVYKVITQIASGKTTGAAKTILLTLLVGGLLFRIDLLFSLISAAGGVVENVITAISELIGGGESTPTP